TRAKPAKQTELRRIQRVANMLLNMIEFARLTGKLSPKRMLKFNFVRRGRIAILLFCTTTLLCRSEERTNRFGFRGPEIFPIENQISQLKNADLDGDGLQDLIVVNNARSKITLLYNQTGKTNDPAVL